MGIEKHDHDLHGEEEHYDGDQNCERDTESPHDANATSIACGRRRSHLAPAFHAKQEQWVLP
jgi:hypothetical protein